MSSTLLENLRLYFGSLEGYERRTNALPDNLSFDVPTAAF